LRCLILSRYGRLAPSSRVRFYQYLPYLECHGVHVQIEPLLGDAYVSRLYSGKPRDWLAIVSAYFHRIMLLLRQPHFDLIWMESDLLPWVPWWVERALFTTRIPSVVDIDDAVFHRYDLHPNRVLRRVLGSKIDRVFRHASLVVAGNPYLADRARSAGAKWIEIIPSVIDLNRYPYPGKFRHVQFTLGWIGSPVTQGYLRSIGSTLSTFGQRENFRLLLVGARTMEIPGVRVEIIPWSEESEVAAIQEFDVGIMPLPDEPVARGKCGYKLIQCMACGLPVVASPVGVNRQIVEHGITGTLALTSSEWLEALCQMQQNAELRIAMGEQGRKKVEAQYSLQITAPRLLSMLTRVAGGSL
jgi:glycosyltransferase involved in cell wall biosynthesis